MCIREPPTTGGAGSSGDESGSSGGSMGEDGDSGCGCRGTPSEPVWLLTPLLLLLRRRKPT